MDAVGLEPRVARLSPRHYLQARLADPHRLRHGLRRLLAAALGYAGCLALLAVGGGLPNPVPWLRIDAEHYFAWEAVFIAPVIVAATVLAAGCLHLLAQAVHGNGSFDATMALVATSAGVATMVTLVPDLVVGVLLTTGLLDPGDWWHAITNPTPVLALVWVYLLLYAAAFVTLFATTASVVYRLPARVAVALGVTTFAIYQLFVFVFVR